METKLKSMPYASAKVIETGEVKALQSYDTIVATIDEDGNCKCNGLYSMTTRKHIGAFAKENGLTFQDFKRMYENKETYNIYSKSWKKVA